MAADAWGARIRDALRRGVSPARPGRCVCRGDGRHRVPRAVAPVGGRAARSGRPATRRAPTAAAPIDVDRLVVALFEQEGQSLVRLARIFVDDRNAAEDLVQEAFIRLARSAHRIQDEAKAAAVPAVDRPEPRPRQQPPRPRLAAPPPPAGRAAGVDRGRDRAPGGPAAGDRRAARAPAPSTHRARPPLLRGARDRRHRRRRWGSPATR